MQVERISRHCANFCTGGTVEDCKEAQRKVEKIKVVYFFYKYLFSRAMKELGKSTSLRVCKFNAHNSDVLQIRGVFNLKTTSNPSSW